jgi:SNF2 family DNA or RNA helicase
MILLGKYPSIELKSEYSAFIKFKTFDYGLIEKVKSLPVRRYIANEKVWEVPIDSINRIVNLFGVDNIQLFTSFPEYEQFIEYRNKHVKGKKSPEELKEFYKNIKPEVDYKFKTAPKGHQIESFNYALHYNSIFITDVMGLGKTKQALDIADFKKYNGQVKHCLIICGLNSIKYNWVDEIKKHSWNNCQVIDGTKKKKLEKLNNLGMFYYNIINVEMLRNDEIVEILESLIDTGEIGMIIADEVHKMANHRSTQGSNLVRLNSRFKIALTGTPITKRVERLWNLLTWMGIITDSYWSFVKRYCVLGGYSGWDVVSYRNMDELHEILDRYQVRRTKDILELPPKLYQTVYVDMTKDEQSEYNSIKRGIIRDLESGDVKYLNPAVATIKLRQFTDTIKQRAVKSLIDELFENDNSAVIFSQYKQGIYDLQTTLSDKQMYVITGDEKDPEIRQSYVNKFQSTKLSEVMMGTIATLGTGYTLTKSNYVIFLNKDWTVGNNAQAEDRCHRIGSEDTVTVISVIVKDTVDERVEEILENDQFYIDQVVDGVVKFRNTGDVLCKLLDLDNKGGV